MEAVIEILAMLGAFALAFLLMLVVAIIFDRVDRSRYMRERDKRRIDAIEKRVKDIERDIYYNGKA